MTEVKRVPYVPLSHPFVERLIGTRRRACLDRMLCWSARDLEGTLTDFQDFYHAHRAPAALDGRTPVLTPREVARLNPTGGKSTLAGSIRRRSQPDV